jgi:hypothetical protein
VIRRVLAAAVALSLVIPVAAEAKDHLARIDQRVPSAQLQATGNGTMSLVGRLAVNGSIPERGTVTVTDRAGDAQAHLAGVPLAFDRRGRARVVRASGILFVSGSDVTVQVTGNRLTFSIAGFGRARLTGEGTYQLNGDPPKAWPGAWIRIAPSSSAETRRTRRCASCSSQVQQPV